MEHRRTMLWITSRTFTFQEPSNTSAQSVISRWLLRRPLTTIYTATIKRIHLSTRLIRSKRSRFMHPTRTVAGQDRSFLNSYVVKWAEDGLNGWHCTICGKSNTQKCNVISHVESAHFAGTFLYTCSYCSKEMKTKNALNIHVRREHRQKISQIAL